MRRVRLFALIIAAAFGVAGPGISSAARAAEVDLALVLAVDASASVSPENWELQRQGYAQAFRSGDVIGALVNAAGGGVAVTMFQWSGPTQQQPMVGWTVLRDAESAHRFAAAVAGAPRAFSDMTSISGAIDFGMALLRSSGFKAARQVIDVSGDGSNNGGRRADQARDEAVAADVTINGLPILASEMGLDAYYRSDVIGGPGAFVVVADGFESFASALVRKLVREIAGTGAAPTQVARLEAPPLP